MADKKIFEQPENTNPELTDNIAIGNSTDPSRTMKLSTLISWLEGKLGFFRTANNLSEGNAVTIRNNISTYSKSEIDTKDGAKADKSNVLELDNTDAYIPTLNYHPATKKYIDDKIIKGTFQYNTPWDVQERIVNIGQTLSSNDYSVLLETATPNGFKGMYPLVVKDKTTTTFTIEISIENSGILEQPLIRWTILR